MINFDVRAARRDIQRSDDETRLHFAQSATRIVYARRPPHNTACRGSRRSRAATRFSKIVPITICTSPLAATTNRCPSFADENRAEWNVANTRNRQPWRFMKYFSPTLSDRRCLFVHATSRGDRESSSRFLDNFSLDTIVSCTRL